MQVACVVVHEWQWETQLVSEDMLHIDVGPADGAESSSSSTQSAADTIIINRRKSLIEGYKRSSLDKPNDASSQLPASPIFDFQVGMDVPSPYFTLWDLTFTMLHSELLMFHWIACTQSTSMQSGSSSESDNHLMASLTSARGSIVSLETANKDLLDALSARYTELEK